MQKIWAQGFWIATLLFLPLSLRGENLNEILIDSAQSGEVEAVKQAISLGADIDYQNAESGWSALMTAAYQGNLSIVQFLISKGAQIDLRDKVGQTALMAAVSSEKSKPEMLQLLLKYGALIDLQRKRDGFTALMLGVKGKKLDLVKILIEQGADPLLKNVSGDSAFDLARQYGIDDALTSFIQQKSSLTGQQ